MRIFVQLKQTVSNLLIFKNLFFSVCVTFLLRTHIFIKCETKIQNIMVFAFFIPVITISLQIIDEMILDNISLNILQRRYK